MEQTLMEILNDLRPDVEFEKETKLIDDGILDSLDIVNLISEISEVYDVTITAKDIIPDNFNSAKALYALIQELEEE